ETTLLDLPGTYSLSAHSPDERITVDVLFGLIGNTAAPDLVLCVVDASNLERNLFLVSQLIGYRLPIIVVLNMMDIAGQEGIAIDIGKLSEELGVRIIPTIANTGIGIDELKSAIAGPNQPSQRSC